MQHRNLGPSASVPSVFVRLATCQASRVRYLTPITGLAIIIAMVPGLALAAPAAESVQFKTIVVEAIQPKVNLLHNAGFEEAGPGGIPAEWQWDRRNTDATCSIDTTTVHRGRQRDQDHQWHGLWTSYLWHAMATSTSQAGRRQALYDERMGEIGIAGIVPLIGGREWQFRVQAHATGGQWHRIQKTFTPAAEDCDFIVPHQYGKPNRGHLDRRREG